MTSMVTSAASPRTLVRAKRRQAAAPSAPMTPAAAAVVRRLQYATLPQAAPTAATPAPAKPAEPEPIEAIDSPEYGGEPLDIGGTIGGVAGGVAGEMLSPYVKRGVGKVLNPNTIPWLGTKHGSVVPGRVAGALTGELAGLVGTVVGDVINGVVLKNGEEPKEGEEPKPLISWKPTPANKLIARTAKGVATTWIRAAVTNVLAPPAPPAPPAPKPAPKPASGEPAPPPPPTPIPAAPPRLVAVKGVKRLVGVPGHGPTDSNNPPPKQPAGPALDVVKPSLPKVQPLVNDALAGLVGVGISALYDQTIGPLVQKAANVITGRADEPIAPPRPLTPGAVVNGVVDSVLGGLLVRSVGTIDFGGAPTPLGIGLGTSIMNNVIGAAWSTVYGRGLGASIEKGVNQAAGLRTKEDQAKDVLPAGEHFARAATRGVAAGAATFLVGKALWAPIMQLGMSIGGVGGLLIAAGGASLIGAVSGGVVDATVGPMLGKLGGNIYSWITGKPSYEQRIAAAQAEQAKKDAATPGPGSKVNAPNGNPGTIPSETPKTGAGAPAAPAAGAPKKRKKTGNVAVDRTSPAINVPNAKIAKIAAASA